VEYHDLSRGLTEKVKIKDVSPETCKFSRPRESEMHETAAREISDVKLAVHCKDSFHVQTASGDLTMKSNELNLAQHGALRKSFVAADSDSLLLHFDDLSLHSYQRNVRLWQREEALS